MPDIRDVLKGLSAEDRAIYTEVRTQMRRAYLYAHTKTLSIEQFNETDDAFLDLIDIKIAMLFDRAGVFDHSEGSLDNTSAKAVEETLHKASDSLATRMIKQELNGNGGWTTQVKQ